jgi:hypothetical protein
VRGGERGRGKGTVLREKGGEITQTLYAHMNKRNLRKKQCLLSPSIMLMIPHLLTSIFSPDLKIQQPVNIPYTYLKGNSNSACE